MRYLRAISKQDSTTRITQTLLDGTDYLSQGKQFRTEFFTDREQFATIDSAGLSPAR
jgi:hypothetical protein